MHAEPIGRQRYNPAADLQPQQSANNLDRGGRHVENSRRRCRNHDRRRVPVRARRPGRQGGHCRRPRRWAPRADVDHVFGLGRERKFRPEQEHRRSAGDDDHHATTRARSIWRSLHRARLARRCRRPIPGAPPPQAGTFNQNITPANAAWTQQLEIWVTPVGLPEGRRGKQRHGPRAEDSAARRTTSSRGCRPRRRPPGRPTAQRLHRRSEHGRARRDLGRASRSSAICTSTRPTATTRISAA